MSLPHDVSILNQALVSEIFSCTTTARRAALCCQAAHANPVEREHSPLIPLHAACSDVGECQHCWDPSSRMRRRGVSCDGASPYGRLLLCRAFTLNHSVCDTHEFLNPHPYSVSRYEALHLTQREQTSWSGMVWWHNLQRPAFQEMESVFQNEIGEWCMLVSKFDRNIRASQIHHNHEVMHVHQLVTFTCCNLPMYQYSGFQMGTND